MTTDDAPTRELSKTVQELHLVVTKLGVTVESLVATVAALATSTVSQDAFSGLRETVQNVDRDARERDAALTKDVDAIAKNWSRLAWAIGRIMLGAVAAALGLKG